MSLRLSGVEVLSRVLGWLVLGTFFVISLAAGVVVFSHADELPQVKLTKPAQTIISSWDGIVRIQYEARDKSGIRRVNLRVQPWRRDPQQIVLWAGESPREVVRGTYIIELKSLHLKPGDKIFYQVSALEAKKVFDIGLRVGKGPNRLIIIE